MKNWLQSSDEEVANMTFNEAREIVENHIALGHSISEFRPRKHMTKALEIMLEEALKNKRRTIWN